MIHRIPLKKNFVTDRSGCPKCGKKILWYENIPVLSYVFLLGKCSVCKQRISIRYPVVEIIAGIFTLYLFPKNISYASLANFVLYISAFYALLVHFFIDLKHKILPDSINIYLGCVFLIYSLMSYDYKHWLIGGAIGFLFPLGFTYAFYLLRKKVGLGGGDIKLFGVLGIILGPIAIIQNIFYSCFLGSIIGLPLILFKIISRDVAIPFGPFIILVAVGQIYFPGLFDSINKMIFGF